MESNGQWVSAESSHDDVYEAGEGGYEDQDGAAQAKVRGADYIGDGRPRGVPRSGAGARDEDLGHGVDGGVQDADCGAFDDAGGRAERGD